MRIAAAALANWKWAGAVVVCACAAAGCDPRSRTDPHITQIQQLEDKIADQHRLIGEKDENLAEQARTIQELRGLSGQRQLDKLVRVARVSIDKLSGGYDDNRDGVDDGVVVYLRVLDPEGDVIKAAGSARVTLVDLAAEEGARTVGRAEWSSEKLRTEWYGKFMTYHYTLRVPWGARGKRPEHKSITAYVRFVEQLSGQVFEDQRVVDIQGISPTTQAANLRS